VIASSLTLRRRAPHEMKRSSLSNAELAARSRGSAFQLFEFRSVTAVWGGVAHSAFTMERGYGADSGPPRAILVGGLPAQLRHARPSTPAVR
jgi:hypothetical protein